MVGTVLPEIMVSDAVPRTELWFVNVVDGRLKLAGKIVDLAYEPNPTLKAAHALWTGQEGR